MDRKDRRWEIRLFGELTALDCEGNSVDLNRTKDQAMNLLAYLAYHAPQWSSKEDLTRLIWNNTGEEYEEQLKPLVSRARRPFKKDRSPAQGSSIIQTRRGERRLNPAMAKVDVTEFKELVATGELTALKKAVDEIYRGPLLLDYLEPWIEDERQKCESLYSQAQQELDVKRKELSAKLSQPFCIASHKFIPIYYGASFVKKLSMCPSSREANWLWLSGFTVKLQNDMSGADLPLYKSELPAPYHMDSHGIAGTPEVTVHCLPFGVAVFHIREFLEFDSIAALATWRRGTHRIILQQDTHLPDRLLQAVTPVGESPCPSIRKQLATGKPSYILSAYYLTEPGSWTPKELETALSLICMPSTLIPRQTAQSVSDPLTYALKVEAALMESGFASSEISSFGVGDISVGYASWSGVSYHPRAPERALSEEALVTLEVAVQSLWCYCHTFIEKAQTGQTCAANEKYGSKFLRSCHSLVQNNDPLEQTQFCLMREAIVETSRILQKLEHAINLLQEA